MMSAKLLRTATVTVALIGGLFAGCSNEGEAESRGFVAQVIDSVALAVADNLTGDTDTAAVQPAGFAVSVENKGPTLPVINDMLLDGAVVYGVYDGGLVRYDLTSQEYSLIEAPENFNAIVNHAGEIFVGGGNLYRLDQDNLVEVEGEYDGLINVLGSYGPSLMVGTTNGLYARNIFGMISLLEDVDISAMVADRDGLWIGTSGDGLYRWDGEQFQKRYLARDECLFDNVTSLAFNHDHLYLGTYDGMFVFNGGRWNQLTEETGLPSAEITSIDASGWVVFVGTDAGLVKYFKGEISPVGRLDERGITAVRSIGQRIIVGTETDGLLLKTGPAVKTIREPWQKTDSGLASVAH